MALKLNLVVTKVDLVDLDFKTYDGTYKDKLANIKKYTNSKGKISFVPTVNVVSIPDLDYPRMTLKAGKEVTLNYPDLIEAGNSNNQKVIETHPLAPMVKMKILSIYYPEKYLNIFLKECWIILYFNSMGIRFQEISHFLKNNDSF